MPRNPITISKNLIRNSSHEVAYDKSINMREFLGTDWLWLLIAALFLSLAVRWPLIPHETGIDSFNIHAFADTIRTLGSIEWSGSILSYFGLFPFSYPSGVPILLSEISIMTGGSLEIIILIFSMITSLIGTLMAFILSLEIRNSTLIAFGVSIGYSLSPLFLVWTQWTVTTRSLFMALLPLTIWIILRYSKISRDTSTNEQRFRYILLLFLLIILTAMIHRMFVIIILLFLGYIASRSAYKLITRHEMTIRTHYERMRSLLINLLIILSIAGIAIYLAIIGGWFGVETYEEGFFDGSGDFIKLLNLIASTAATSGLPLTMLFPFSFAFIILGKKEFAGIFLIACFLILLAFSGGRTYERILYPIIIIPLIFHSVRMIRKNPVRRKFAAILIMAFLITIPGNLLIVDYYNHWSEKKVINDGNAISEQTYATAMYMREYYNGYHYICSNWIASIRIQAYSGSAELPCGSFSMVSNILIYGIINSSDLQIQGISIDEIILNKGIPFESEWEIRIISDWGKVFLSTNLDTRLEILRRYDTKLFIEDTRLDMKIVGYQSIMLYPSGESHAYFIDDGPLEKNSVHDNCYKIYENGREVIWLLNR